MLFLIFLLLFTNIVSCSQVGSTLFYKRLTNTDCWSVDEIIKLEVRKALEDIVPQSVKPNKINDFYISETLRYVRNAFKTIDRNSNKNTHNILKEVLADTIGAHMRSDILPAARFSYYAGYVSYRKVRELHNCYDQLKVFLNTQGLGWKKPYTPPDMGNFTVEKIRIGPSDVLDPCARLVTKRDSKSCIHLPVPKLDDHFHPSSIALPFKNDGLVSLTSPVSDSILLKYYSTASKCILHSSPNTCRHVDFVSFNNDLWHWMKRDVAPRLLDEKLYAAYGGVLRIAAAVQSYGKGLHRRNLFNFQDSGVSKWHPWKALKESYVYVNMDWTPHLYVAVVLLISLIICLLQIFYSFIFGDENGCHCKGTDRSSLSKEVAYAKVESSIPAMLPSHQSAVYYSDKKRSRKSIFKTKTSSLGSMKTQKVYDMHENTEKLMDVIMSGSESTSESSVASQSSQKKIGNIIDVGHPDRSRSPPKIETHITQIKVDKKCVSTKPEMPMYSTSTVTTAQTYQCEQATDSWSGSESCTSTQSLSSGSSKSRARRSRSSRDLAWAKRVVSKHSLHAKSTSGTELEVNSFTTPLSHR